jgi:sarcosine oxidase, subunit beta
MSARSVDAIVIGAGIVGSSVALELARAGRTVVIVDRNSGPGQGSTSASSAILRMHYSTWAGVATAWEARSTWAEWGTYLEAGDDEVLARYVNTGVLAIESPDFKADRVMGLFTSAGIPYEHLSGEEIAEHFPYLNVGRYFPPKSPDDDAFWSDADSMVSALFTTEGGYVDDPTLASLNLLNAAKRHGAETMFRCTVTEITRSGGRVTGINVDNSLRIDSSVVVNCAGPKSAVVNELAGVLGDFRISTRPLRQEVHELPAPSALAPGQVMPVLSDSDLGTYIRSQPSGAVLVGGMEPACDPLMWLSDGDLFDMNPTTEAYRAQALRAARRIPSLTVPHRPKGAAGVYDVTEDWIPIYDVTSLTGFYVAIGTSGNQFKNAPVIGQMIRALIEESESGRDHDRDPVAWTAPRTRHAIPLGNYSRLRQPNTGSSNSVLG